MSRTMATQRAGWTKLGRYFGYPECCIKVFCEEHWELTSMFPDTGFRPCRECAPKGKEFLLSEIKKNRVCSEPFPKEPHLSLFDEFWAAHDSGENTDLLLAF